MHTMNEKDEHYKLLVLAPDYSSSGIWCSCGVEVSNPIETTNIPESLVELIEGWNLLWQHMSLYPENVNVEDVEDRLTSIGTVLSDMVSQYTPCILRKEHCKLNISNWK